MKDMADKGRHEYPSGPEHYNWTGGIPDRNAYQRQWRANQDPEKAAERRRKNAERERQRRARQRALREV